MLDRPLHRYCRSVVNETPIPRPFSIEALCRALAAKNGRRIYLHPYPPEMAGDDMPCGVLVATTVADHIFFEKKTSPYHQTHIIMHELGHMLCRHSSSAALDGSALVGAGSQVTDTMLRTSYSTRQEREAELVATMILERAMVWDSNADAEERYFGEILGFP